MPNYSNVTPAKAQAAISAKAGKTASIRTEVIKSYAGFSKSVDHDLRATKKALKSVTNDKGFYTYDGSNLAHHGNLSDYGKAQAKNLKALYKDRQINHRDLVMANGNKNTRFNNPELNGSSKDIRATFAESIIYYGKDVKDDEGNFIKQGHLNALIAKYGEEKIAKQLLKSARESMVKMAKKFNFELIGDAQIHLDEDGQMHVHQLHTNYDKTTGASPNFQKKIGAISQSMIAQDLKSLGFKRGVPAEIRKIAGLDSVKHLNIKQYKAQQDSQTAIIKANKELKAINRKIKKQENQSTLLEKATSAYQKKKAAKLQVKLDASVAELKEEKATIQAMLADSVTQAGEYESLKTEFAEFKNGITEETKERDKDAQAFYGKWGYDEAKKKYEPEIETFKNQNRDLTNKLKSALDENDKVKYENIQLRMPKDKEGNILNVNFTDPKDK